MSLADSMMTGFFTGISLFVANWASKTYLESRLNKTHNIITGSYRKLLDFMEVDRHVRKPLQKEKIVASVLQAVKGRDDKMEGNPEGIPRLIN